MPEWWWEVGVSAAHRAQRRAHSISAEVVCPAIVLVTTIRLLAVGLRASGRWRHKRGRVDGRHPDSRLIDLEQVRHERIKIDVRIRKVVKSKFLPVPICQKENKKKKKKKKVSNRLGER